jgi:antitoxin VapB
MGSAMAKLFMNGRSQAVRLPKEFRFEGDEVRIRKTAEGAVILEPLKPTRAKDDIDAWVAKLVRFNEVAGEFMPEGRNQPPMPVSDDLFE